MSKLSKWQYAGIITAIVVALLIYPAVVFFEAVFNVEIDF